MRKRQNNDDDGILLISNGYVRSINYTQDLCGTSVSLPLYVYPVRLIASLSSVSPSRITSALSAKAVRVLKILNRLI